VEASRDRLQTRVEEEVELGQELVQLLVLVQRQVGVAGPPPCRWGQRREAEEEGEGEGDQPYLLRAWLTNGYMWSEFENKVKN